MPFGKYKGWLIREVPDDYTEWLLSIDLREPLASRVQAEARRRGLCRDMAVSPQAAQELVTAGLHSLARKHHPDAGGDPRWMVEINLAAEWLRGQVAGLARNWRDGRLPSGGHHGDGHERHDPRPPGG